MGDVKEKKLHRAVDGRTRAYKYSIIGMQLAKANEKGQTERPKI